MSGPEQKSSFKEWLDTLLARWDSWTEEQLRSQEDAEEALTEKDDGAREVQEWVVARETSQPRIPAREPHSASPDSVSATTPAETPPSTPVFPWGLQAQSWWPRRKWYLPIGVRWAGMWAAVLVISKAVIDAIAFVAWEDLEQIVHRLAALIALWVVLVSDRKEYAKFLGLADPGRLKQHAHLTAMLGIGLVQVAAVLSVLKFVASVTGSKPDAVFGDLSVGLSFIGIVVAATWEEFMYRGFLLGAFMRRWGPRGAVHFMVFWFWLAHVWPTLLTFGAITSIGGALALAIGTAFGSAHIVALGYLLGWYQLRTGSIYGCVVLHVVWNMVVTWAPMLLAAVIQ